jgi:hypothetical protein
MYLSFSNSELSVIARKLEVLTPYIRLCFSEKMYGALFRALSEVLTSLFQKSRELQLHFLEVVSDNLQFKCMYENELMLLTES